MTHNLGDVRRMAGVTEVTISRHFDHKLSDVWAMLTESARLADWLAPGSIELRDGGAAKLDFAQSGYIIDSKVTALDAPFLIEYSWSSPGQTDRPIRWELSPTRVGTNLKLVITLPAEDDVARACAGWEAHLDMLAAALEGVPIKFPFERFKAARGAYGELLAHQTEGANTTPELDGLTRLAAALSSPHDDAR